MQGMNDRDTGATQALLRDLIHEILRKPRNAPQGYFELEIPYAPQGQFPGPDDLEELKQLARDHGLQAWFDASLNVYKVQGRLMDLGALDDEIEKRGLEHDAAQRLQEPIPASRVQTQARLER